MMKKREADIERGQEADYYCRCGLGHAFVEPCKVCGCDYWDSVTPIEREREELDELDEN